MPFYHEPPFFLKSCIFLASYRFKSRCLGPIRKMMKRCRGFVSNQCGKYIFSVNALRNSERYFRSALLGESTYICKSFKGEMQILQMDLG
jgi:hypothetical protein